MSYKLMHDVLHCDAVSGTDKYVLMALADHANDKTLKCFPAQETLSRELGLVRRTISSSIKRLKASGLLVVDRSGFARSNSYLIVLPDSPQQSHSDTAGQDSHMSKICSNGAVTDSICAKSAQMESSHMSKICSSSVQNIPVIRADSAHHMSKICTLTSNVTSNTTSNIKKGVTPYNPPIDENGASPSDGKGNEVAEVRHAPTEETEEVGNAIPAGDGTTLNPPEYSTESVEDFKKWLAHTSVAKEVGKIFSENGCGPKQDKGLNEQVWNALLYRLQRRGDLRDKPNRIAAMIRGELPNVAADIRAENERLAIEDRRMRMFDELDYPSPEEERQRTAQTIVYPHIPFSSSLSESEVWVNWLEGEHPELSRAFKSFCSERNLAATQKTALALYPQMEKVRDEFLAAVLPDRAKDPCGTLFSMLGRQLDAAS